MRKMIIEYAQLLSTAHRLLNPNCPDNIYRATHANHPSNVWCRETKSNYKWLYKLYKALCEEYTFRTGKVHASARFLNELSEVPPGVPEGPLTLFALAMPHECKVLAIPTDDESIEDSNGTIEEYLSDFDTDFDYSNNRYGFQLAVESYRNYYNMNKQTYIRKTNTGPVEVPFTIWTKREKPYWFIEAS
jgi:hypothetical protein